MFPSFQIRIGNMDGAIVAYHNTARLFGFQYIPLDEIDTCLFGGKGRGDRVFQKCVGLLEEVADEITGVFPDQVRRIVLALYSYFVGFNERYGHFFLTKSIQCTFETNQSSVLQIWVEPSEWDTKEGPCPIVQLDVRVTNYLNATKVDGSQAVSTIGLPCSSPATRFLCSVMLSH